MHEGTLYRQVNLAYQPSYDQFMGTGLYGELASDGLLIEHTEASLSLARTAGAYKVIAPRPLGFVSYPYEWCFGQLKDAALLTLEIQSRALKKGMTLRDASAYNVQFVDGRPLFIDTLSLGVHKEGSPWHAYRQFVQHFLAPLALMSHRDVGLGQLFRVYIDGVPLDLASKLLPWRTQLNPSIQLHVHAHARMQRKYQATPEAGAASARKMGARALASFVESLRGAVQGLNWTPAGTTWGDYYQGDSYDQAGLDHKRDLVAGFLDRIAPRSLWDLGANTGLHSRLASSRGVFTVAWDVDPAAVEHDYRQVVKEKEKNLLPLLLDLTNPSGSLGWANEERMSLQERGPADAVMALALIHHLAIANNLPLDRVASYFAGLGRHLIIEFVPKEDPKVRHLLASREDIFPGYTREGFEGAFTSSFRIVASEKIRHSERTLYLMERLPEGTA